MTDNLTKVSFTIHDIEILSKSLSIPELKDSKLPEFEFKIGLEITTDIENKHSIHIISTEIVSKENNKQCFADLKIACIYAIYNFDDVSVKMDNGISLRQDVIELFNTITIGTLRGILYSELRGTILHSAILPILDIKSFVKSA
jgi:hypothetical protein